MKPRIAILGAGPSAAYAYQACLKYGSYITIFAQSKKSPPGAFWLWSLPKHISSKTRKALQLSIRITKRGSAEQYSKKMWGTVVPTSFPIKEFTQMGYHPRRGLVSLWDKATLDSSLGVLTESQIKVLARDYDLVIQTFPTDSSLRYQPEPVPFVVATRCFLETEVSIGLCIYNGTRNQEWTRATIIGSQISFEYPPTPNLTKGDLLDFVGPKHSDWDIGTGLDLHPDTQPDEDSGIDNVLLVGRSAQWKRKMLSHEAFDRVSDELITRFGNAEGRRTQ